MSDESNMFVMAGIGFFGGLFLFFKSFSWFREMRLIQNTPTSKIRSLAMGRVEVAGKIVPNDSENIVSPFTGVNCVYCRWTIEEYRSSGKSSRWVTVRRGEEGRYFYVNDGTGQVLVDREGAKVDINPDGRIRGLSEIAKKSMDAMGYRYKGFIFNKSIRLTEWILEPEDTVYVMGFAGDNPFVEDGTSDRNEKDIMIQKNGKQFFYISDKPEKEVVDSYKFKSFGGMIGGGILALVCLAIIFGMIGML